MCILAGSSRVELSNGRTLPVTKLYRHRPPVAVRAAHVIAAKRIPCLRVIVLRLDYGGVCVRLSGSVQTTVGRCVAGGQVEHVALRALRVGDALLARGRARAHVRRITKWPSRHAYQFQMTPPGAALLVDGAVFVW